MRSRVTLTLYHSFKPCWHAQTITDQYCITAESGEFNKQAADTSTRKLTKKTTDISEECEIVFILLYEP